LDEAEEREIRKLKRRLIAEKKTLHEHGGEKKRKVSPSRYSENSDWKILIDSFRHPESDIVHIRGLTRPFTDRALKAEITKSGGQIVDFWIDSVKSHCIVQVFFSNNESLSRIASAEGSLSLKDLASMKKSDHLVGGRPGVRSTSQGIQSVTPWSNGRPISHNVFGPSDLRFLKQRHP
uniref:RRM domain-containing protein n=1 Tax=Haemonchus placei TaxID=6290 RepID=A0A0N4W9X0_HAEPC